MEEPSTSTRPPDAPVRARDTGVRPHQIAGPTWVKCPRCAGAARDGGFGLTCLACGHSERIFATPRRRPPRGELDLLDDRLNCGNRACRARLPATGRAVRGSDPEHPLATVTCLSCGARSEHSAHAVPATRRARETRQFWHRHRRAGTGLYLTRTIGSEQLYVYNRHHLELLESWIGAALRERGSPIGGTVVTRLPRWMIAARNRPLVLDALADIREQMDREGLKD